MNESSKPGFTAERPSTEKPPVLELRKISKSFPGTRALDDVSLTVREGEVVALLGENGAGKSTLMKILSGVWPAGSYDGEIRISPRPGAPLAKVEFKSTDDAHAAGIGMIHQELSVFRELTVAENLELDRLPKWIRWNELFERTQKFIASIQLDLQSNARVGDLSVGGRQLVEIAKALSRRSRILVFDEPTSALTDSEVTRLYEIIARLRSEGHGIIYITHRMDEIFQLADRMVVLRDGKYVAETPAWREGVRIPRSELEPKLITWMVGRSIQDVYPPKNAKIGGELLRVENLSVQGPNGRYHVRDFSFKLNSGEVLGFAGLLGSGRSWVFEAIFGVLHEAGPRSQGFRVSGNVWIKGRRYDLSVPQAAIRARIGFVSEDRKGNGLILSHAIQANMSLPAFSCARTHLTRGPGLFSRVIPARERDTVLHWKKELRLKAADIGQPIGQLSGGNQQKVVLAKWLLTEPEILFLDEPTRGIDVGAKVEIYEWIQKLAGQGMGIVMASSEMPEVIGLSHRIIVLRKGRVSADLPAQEVTQEQIMRAASL